MNKVYHNIPTDIPVYSKEGKLKGKLHIWFYVCPNLNEMFVRDIYFETIGGTLKDKIKRVGIGNWVTLGDKEDPYGDENE